MEAWFRSPCGNNCCIKDMFFGKSYQEAMLFRDKAPGFFSLKPLEQLNADTVHLGGMHQRSLFLASVLERDGSCMERIVTGLTEGQQIRFIIASLLATENEMMHFEPLFFGLPFAVLTAIVVSR